MAGLPHLPRPAPRGQVVVDWPPETESELRAGIERIRARLAERRRKRMTRLRQFAATIGIVVTVSVVASWLVAWVNALAFGPILARFGTVTLGLAVGGWIVFALIEWGWDLS